MLGVSAPVARIFVAIAMAGPEVVEDMGECNRVAGDLGSAPREAIFRQVARLRSPTARGRNWFVHRVGGSRRSRSLPVLR